MSKNCFISSSRLSLRSLWPRVAVFSRPFSRFSSILVGFMVAEAICSPLSYNHPFSDGRAGDTRLCKGHPRQNQSFFGRYLSIMSCLMRLSSLLGRMLSSSQPRSRVSRTLRLVS